MPLNKAQTSQLYSCIYCGDEVDPCKGKKDHIIPIGLGEFGNNQNFRRICDKCNHIIGLAEQELLQCSYVRIYRDFALPNSRKSWRGAHGKSPPKIALKAPEGNFMAKPSKNAGHFEVYDQIILVAETGEEFVIELHPGMSANSLKDKIKLRKAPNLVGCRIHSRESNKDHYLDIIKEIFPNSAFEVTSLEEKGTRMQPASVKQALGEAYFRSIAKIAFHFYLINTLRFKGSEIEFSPLRHFIMHGGKKDIFFIDDIISNSEKRFYVPSRWQHIIFASEETGNICAYVKLFEGPDFPGRIHRLILGMVERPLIIAKYKWLWVYKYFNKNTAKGKVGEVIRNSYF